jgi:hypothetical protein
VLQNYADYVRTQQAFPLTAFRSRHSAATEAVGYGKTLMLFHMLRLQLGDAAFIRGLRALYAQYRFRDAGFADVEAVFSVVGGQLLSAFFDQWLKRAGAPQLRISGAQVRPDGQHYVLNARIEQVQEGATYLLRVPVAIRLEGRKGAWQTVVLLEDRRQTLELKLSARPLQLIVDPEFDVFRRLDRNEMPPAISQATGAEKVTIVLPSTAPEPLHAAYAELAASWKARNPRRFSIVVDKDLPDLPDDGAIWLFGWGNRFRPELEAALADYAVSDQGDSVTIAGTPLDFPRPPPSRPAGPCGTRNHPGEKDERIEAHIFVAFMAYCLQVTLKQRLRSLAPGLTPRAALEKFAALQMVDVHLPTRDGRRLVLPRYTQPEKGSTAVAAATEVTASGAAATQDHQRFHSDCHTGMMPV